MQSGKIAEYIDQFIRTLLRHRKAVDFIYDHKLWKGLWRYGWVSKLLIFIAILLGLNMLQIILDWVRELDVSTTRATISSLGSLTERFYDKGKAILLGSGSKYLMLILLEVVVFHFCRRTLAIIANREADASFKEFVNAQKRMIKVALRSWILEAIITAVINAAFSISVISFLGFLSPVIIGGVQCFFLGWAVVDNYNEQFGLTIKESIHYTRDYLGVSLAVGVVLYVLMFIPIAGPVVGPLLAAVTATLVMYEIADLHLRPEPAEAVEGEETV